jgi:endogenous inhibitor of DNA gyrase (YacG/DUF329 family)
MRFRCSTCRREIPREAPFFPFCSTRCRDVDLGKWLDESHRIAGVSLFDAIDEDTNDEEPGASASERDEVADDDA